MNARREVPEPTFGEWLKDWLERRNLLQRDVAEAVGVSQGTVSAWVNDQKQPTRRNCQLLARLLGVPAEEVMRRAGHRVAHVRPAYLDPITPIDDPALDHWTELGRALTPDEREYIIGLVHSLRQRRSREP